MELSPSSGGAAEALSWPEMFPGLESSESPLPPEDLDAVVPVGGAMVGGMLDRILLESVCQQQSWVRVYGKDPRGSAWAKSHFPFPVPISHPISST
jgi:RAS protein activator-like 2